MTNQRPRRATRVGTPLPAEAPRVHRLYSLGVGLLTTGQLTVILGRMDLTTKRYQFFTPADSPFEWPLNTTLHDLLVVAAGQIDMDPETVHL